jgi:hypothetical protein
LKAKLTYQKKKTEKKTNQANKQTHIRVSIHEGGKPLFNNNFSKGDQSFFYNIFSKGDKPLII